MCVLLYIYIYIYRRHQTCHFRKRATSAPAEDLRTGSISRDVVNFPSELGRRRSGVFTEVARWVPPEDARVTTTSIATRKPGF